MLYSFEIFFLLTCFLIWLGSVISLLFGLFKNGRSNFIMATPKFGTLRIYTLCSSLLSSVWILLFVLAPALWAGEVVFHSGFWAFILEMLACLLIIIFSVLLAYVMILGTAYIWRFLLKSGPGFLGLALCLAILTFMIFGVVAAKISHNDIVAILSTEDLKLSQAPLGPVLQSFKLLPTSMAAQIVTFGQLGELGKTSSCFAVLALLIIIELLLTWLLGKAFLPLWQSLAESGGAARGRPGNKIPKSNLLNSPFGAVLYKEKIQLFRNPKNAFWLMFLLLLWLSYIGFTLTFQLRLRKDSDQISQLPNIILAVQLLVLVYFVSALCLRFVFPSFSSERNTAWIFACSPLRLGRLLWAKFWFFALTFGGFALLAEAVNVLLLKLPGGQAGLFLTLGLTTVFTLCALGLYFGVKFANFETDDPQALGTSVPGLIFMLCAVIYGALSAYVYYVFLSAALPALPVTFILASLLFSWILMASAALAVKHTDFAPQYN